mgnify:CR=1 FL=1
MNKYVLLDFCETVVDFQTFDVFILYVLQKKRPLIYKIFKCKIINFVLDKLTALSIICGHCYCFKKRCLVLFTKGISKDDFQFCGKEFYENVLTKHFINDVLGLLEKFKKEKLEIIIISGGSNYYIDCFAKQYEIEHVITAKIAFKDNISEGRLENECLGKDKIKLLDKYMEKNKIHGKIAYTVTDSISDMPIIDRAEKAVIISYGKHKKWVNEKMEEIIWS